MEYVMKALPVALVYLAVIWIISIALTLSDKRRARKNKRRIRERTLLIFGALGGALPMYITMKKIHHKTLHNKFMVGLPLIMILHIAVIIFMLYQLTK